MTVDHYEALFNSKYLRWFDIAERKEVTVEIEGVTVEELTLPGGAKDNRPVMRFKGAKKPLVLNKTNANAIAELHGVIPSKWKGKPITLQLSQTKCKGQMRPCIRIKTD